MLYLVSAQEQLYNSKLFDKISLEKGIELLDPLLEISLDTETSGLDCFTKDLLLLQLGNFDFQVLFDINSYGGKIPQLLVDFLNTSTSLFLMQNAKFDLKFLFIQGVIIKKVYDTMLVETILTNGLQFGGRDLKTITEKYCNVTLDKSVRGDIIKFGLTDAVLVYGAKDVKYLPMIKEKQLIQVEKFDLLNAITLDNSFVVVLAYTEYCGIKLDYNKWKKRTIANKEQAYKLKSTLEAILLKDGKTKYFSGMADLFSGEQDCILNWDSPKQVIELFKEYGINVILKAKGESKETIDAKILAPQKDLFDILPAYLDYKAIQKEVSTYGENWEKFINPVTGRIHTTFKQLMDTGRLSCGNKRDGTVNLQNIPSDHETRECFIPEDDCLMIDADYCGQETIILVNQSQEKNLINFYTKGFDDMHSYVAFLMFKDIRPCALEDISKESLEYIKKNHKDKRQIAKSAGFAIAYGGNGSTIAKNCNISKEDGDFVYNSYFEAFPNMKNYFTYVFNKASQDGFITFNPVTKRKYFFNKQENDYFKHRFDVSQPDFWRDNHEAKSIFRAYNTAKSEISRVAQNFPIQGTAADTTKYACIILFKEILKRNWFGVVKIVNLVHDELLIECPKELIPEVEPLIVSSMEEGGKPFCRIVELKAEAMNGPYWIH